ncbi:MAG TPA: penicillin-binding protein 2, partial [Planctomycetaceae bacterium]|nr:penicillin-binding protein 2 [Planctomycetaceae bacterium]
MPNFAADQIPIVRAWRSRLIVSLVGVCGLVLAGRLVQLQWLERSRFSRQADRQRTFVEPIPARPGDVLDREGRLLATTVTRQSLYVVPSRLDDPAEAAVRIAAVLKLDGEALAARLEQHRARHFLWIKRRLDDDEADSIRRLSLADDAWGFREEYLRRYPHGRLAAHVIGLRDIDGAGRGGVEQSFDPLLRGRDGCRVLIRDARG